MSKLILLDSGPLGIISNPSKSEVITDCQGWVRKQRAKGDVIIVPEIADYEVRRELLRANKINGIARLNLIKNSFAYLSITTSVMLRAAGFWAQARKRGKPSADNSALDADVILAAQAAILIDEGSNVVIASSNPRHLTAFAPAAQWDAIV